MIKFNFDIDKSLFNIFSSTPYPEFALRVCMERIIESPNRAFTYLIAVLSGRPTLAEHHGDKGRSDLEVFVGKYIYLFEFKYNKSVEEAMDQIHSRDYAGRYALESRTVYLIGANFPEEKEERGLQFEIEKL